MAGTTVTNKKKTHEGKRGHFRCKSVTLDKRKKHKKNTEEDEGRRRRRKGPGLPSVLRKELDLLNPNPELSEDDANSDEGGEEKAERNDLYEYDEPVPQEESQKNRRFDPIENLEYELPEDFKDENVPSSDDDDGGSEEKDGTDTSDELEVDAEENDENKHSRMLQEITGMPGEAFQGKKRKKGISSMEFSPSEEALDGPITIHDLLDPLHGKPGYSKLRKRMYQLEKSSLALQAPLPKSDREKLERKAAYVQSKKDITKWEPLVKRNREAPTLFFDEDVNVGYSTVGAIASEFEPRTEFEKKISSILNDPEVMDAHKEDGARLLELNKISVEDIKDRQSRLAKMRSLLFRHEMKAKHIKKIKSKTYHRMLKRDRLKAASTEMEMDPEAAKELAMKQELKRAEERMTLKHKNSSKWAKRILKRGLKAQDESTRAAISEQLHLNTLLTRKMNSINDNSSSDESTASGEDDLSSGSDAERPSKLLKRAKERTEKTLKTIEHEDEMPKSGVLSLPFMVRGMKKRKEAAYEEAELALQEYDSQLRQLDDENGVENLKPGASSGRRVFGVTKSPAQEINNKIRSDNMDKDSDSEGDFEAKEKVDLAHLESTRSSKEVHVDPGILPDLFDAGHEAVFKSIDEIVGKPGLKSTYEVAIFASELLKKLKNGKELDGCNKISSTVISSDIPHEHLQNEDQNSDTDSDVMVDGFILSGAKPDYELPSQADLIHRAFAGDDVEAEFEKDKMEILNEENPEPEKPIVLPGWGQWTDIQQKKGLPSWIVQEHKNAKKKREDALKKRKDARLKHVIISEKVDKKAEKLHSKTLPFPYTSKEVFEQSIRMPIGPEFNPATSVGALNRPAVVKKAGIIIKPIQFVEVDPHEKVEESKQVKKAPKASKTNKGGGVGRKGGKKTKEHRT